MLSSYAEFSFKNRTNKVVPRFGGNYFLKITTLNMKKISVLLVFVLTAYALSAQLGIKGGVNASNLSTDNDDIENIESKLGYQLGVVLDIPLSETVWIRPEAIFIRKGGKYDYFDTDVRVDMNYVDFPITLSFQPKLLPISIHIGPQFSYLVNTSVRYENGLLGSVEIEDTDRNNFEDFDLGLALGLALQLNNAFLEMRYTHSLKEYEKSSEIGSLSIEPSSQHFNLQLSLGYFF